MHFQSGLPFLILHSLKTVKRQETPNTVVLECFNTTYNIEVLKSDIYIYKREEK